MRLSLSLTLLLTAAACAPAPAKPPVAPPAPPPTVVATPPSPPAPRVARLQAGQWPGATGHRWGSRVYELRPASTGWQVRVHDEINFQGAGMRPEDMAPPRQGCTAWEPLPAGITPPSPLPSEERSCESMKELCEGIRAWDRARESAAPDPRMGPGPAVGSCAD